MPRELVKDGLADGILPPLARAEERVALAVHGGDVNLQVAPPTPPRADPARGAAERRNTADPLTAHILEDETGEARKATLDFDSDLADPSTLEPASLGKTKRNQKRKNGSFVRQ